MFDNNGKLIIPTLEENQEHYQKEYLKTFGLVDIEPSSALGSDLAITSEMKKISNEFTQHAFIQNSPFEATGKGLDNLCFLRGIKRKENEHSICLVTFTGADDLVIPKGTIVTNTSNNEEFLTDEQGVIVAGEFSVFATAVNSGRIVCNTGTLLESNVDDTTVTNPNDGIVGFDIESDTSLRVRLLNYQNTLNTDERLFLKIRDLFNVKFVNIVSNPELVPDGDGVEARSTAIIVLGGNEKTIAKTIFSTIPADKKTVGSITEYIASEITQKEYIVRFSRPEILSPTIEVTLDITDKFDNEDIGVIKESILSYFYDKFAISDDVLIDSLYIPVQQDYNNNNLSFIGISKVSIKINNLNENLSVAYNKYAMLSSDNLSILTS